MKPNTPTHKKNDDEETKGFIESGTFKENDSKISRLERNVNAIKQLTSGISNQIKADDKVIHTLQSGFDRSKALVNKSLSRMDQLVGDASSSMTTYIVLFLLMILGLMYKFML